MAKPSTNWIANAVREHVVDFFGDNILVTQKNRYILLYNPKKGYWEMDTDDNILTGFIVEFLREHSYTFDDVSNQFTLIENPSEGGQLSAKFSLFNLLTDVARWVSIFINNVRVYLVYYSQMNLDDMPNHSYEKIIDDNRYIFINVQNGVVRINRDNSEVILDPQHNIKHYFRARIETEYRVEAECPTWHDFLETVVEEEVDIDYIRSFMAYSLLDFDFRWEAILYIYGEGANGKGTLVRAFSKLFSKAANISLSALNETFGLMGLVDANFWWANENDGKHLETELLKRIASGEPISYNIKHKKPMETTFKLKVIVTANEIPLLKKYAEKRRVLILRFPHRFEGDDKDIYLDDKLIEELPGLFNWIVDEIPYMLENSAKLSEGINDRYEESYNSLADPFKIFVETYISKSHSPDDVVYTRDLVRAFNCFADHNQHARISSITAGRRFKAFFKDGYSVNTIIDESDPDDPYTTKNTRMRGQTHVSLDRQAFSMVYPGWDSELYDYKPSIRHTERITRTKLPRLEFLKKLIEYIGREPRTQEELVQFGEDYLYGADEVNNWVRMLLQDGRLTMTPNQEIVRA